MENKQHEKNNEEAQETPKAQGTTTSTATLTCARLYVHSRATVEGLYNTQVDQLIVSGVVQDVYGLSGNSTVSPSPDKDPTASERHRAFVKITE